MGFNPTDDGFILAYSRRIIEGQIPHLDFITIRPAGSAFLHVPFVLWGGDYTYWISRLFVWFQFGVISWVWMNLTTNLIRPAGEDQASPLRSFWIKRLLFGLIIFCFTVAYFPIMAWHTIDGMFLASLGLWLISGERQARKIGGYFLLGLSYLCKQNFIVIAVAPIILFGDWRKIKYWISLAVPGIIYFIYLLFEGALREAVVQMTAQSDLLSIGFVVYAISGGFLIGLPIGFLSGYYLTRPEIKGSSIHKISLAVIVTLILCTAAVTLALGHLIEAPSFAIFGFTVGAVAGFLKAGNKEGKRLIRLSIIIIIFTWAISLSVGYNSPALGVGIMAALLLVYAEFGLRQIRQARWMIIMTAIVCIGSIIGFDIARHEHIYRDRPAKELTQLLDGVLPGGHKIKTNPRTHEFLTDLGRAIQETKGEKYAIIPDCAGYWVKAKQVNPLPIDWAQGTELCTPELLQRVTDAIEKQRDSTYVLVQNVLAWRLREEYIPQLENKYYGVVKYVHTHLNKVGETRLFEIYK